MNKQTRKKYQQFLIVPPGKRKDGSRKPYTTKTENLRFPPSQIHRVWGVTKEFDPGDVPQHHVNAFLEDRGHDWFLLENNSIFKYCGIHSWSGGLILIEFRKEDGKED